MNAKRFGLKLLKNWDAVVKQNEGSPVRVEEKVTRVTLDIPEWMMEHLDVTRDGDPEELEQDILNWIAGHIDLDEGNDYLEYLESLSPKERAKAWG